MKNEKSRKREEEHSMKIKLQKSKESLVSSMRFNLN